MESRGRSDEGIDSRGQTVAPEKLEVLCYMLVLFVSYFSDFSRKILLGISSAVFIYSANIDEVPISDQTLC